MCATRACRFLSYLLLSALISSAVGQQTSDNQPSPDTATATVTVAVTDHNHRVITDLKAEHFTLFEDGQPRPIRSVTFGDVPACIGLLLDQSGSMREHLSLAIAALMEFARASNSVDRFFVVNFSDEPYLDQDFTQNLSLLEEGLAHAKARGGTAFYDALSASAEHLAKGRECNKRILVILSDGVDNESQMNLEQTLGVLQNSGNPAIYVIGLSDDRPSPAFTRSRHALEALTSPAGGAAYFVGNAKDLNKTALTVAEEIRNQYSVTYVPAPPQPGGLRKIVLEAHAPGHKDLVARGNVATKVDLSAALIPARKAPGCITGVVVDENNKRVADVNVQAWPLFTNSYPKDSYPSTVTDENGKFKMDPLEAGPYQLYTKKESAGYPPTKEGFYRDRTLPITQASVRCADVVVKVGPKAARIRINAVDANTQGPVPHFGVSLRASGNTIVVSRAEPGQEIMVPPGAELTIKVWAPPYIMSRPIVIQAPGSDASQEVTVALEPRDNASRKVPER